MSRIAAFVLPLALGLVPAVLAQPGASFTPIGDWSGGTFFSNAWAVSADGSTVVGHSIAENNRERAFRWTAAGGLQGLAEPTPGVSSTRALGVSGDGQTVVGWTTSPGGNHQACIWHPGNTQQLLGYLPGGSGFSEAQGVSADGAVVAGFSRSTESGPNLQAFRHTAATGIVGLGDLPGDLFNSSAYGVSGDGGTIVGYGYSDRVGSREAMRWTEAGGMVGLGSLSGSNSSTAYGVNANGSVITGTAVNQQGTAEAFRWTAAGMVGLGDLPGGIFESRGWGASADGTHVVGMGRSSEGDAAFLWTEATGMLNLKDYLVSLGVTGLEGWRLVEARAISADNWTIVGNGINPLGQTEAWVVTIPGPSGALLLVGGILGFSVRRRGRSEVVRGSRRRRHRTARLSSTQPSVGERDTPSTGGAFQDRVATLWECVSTTGMGMCVRATSAGVVSVATIAGH